MTDLGIWLGIVFCISQSAMFSGLNLAFFSITKMRLQIEISHGNQAAAKVAAMREDSNFLLTTILWGNVGINVLLTLLSNSVMAGVVAFLFSTIIITLFGEIAPQAYFSRNALKMASVLSPVLRFYQMLLYPIAKPSAKILDMWLGKESLHFFREHEIEEMLRIHIHQHDSDITHVEGKGALNFLAIDDLRVSEEGEIIDPLSIIPMKFEGKKPIFPDIRRSPDDRFLKRVHQSGKSWIILTDFDDRPRLVMDADGFLGAALFQPDSFDPYEHCHRPMIITNEEASLGDVLPGLRAEGEHDEDDVIDKDIILIWGSRPRIITGADILGRLLRGIAAK
jgi:CBS domain containing-hemolysin-like protein